MVVGFRVLVHVARRDVICDEFSHPREVETTLDHTEGSVYPTVACDDGVMAGRDDFLDAVLRCDDFIVCPQSSILEVLTLAVLSSRVAGLTKYVKTSGSCR